MTSWPELSLVLQDLKLVTVFDTLAVERSATWNRVSLEGVFDEDSQVKCVGGRKREK